MERRRDTAVELLLLLSGSLRRCASVGSKDMLIDMES